MKRILLCGVIVGVSVALSAQTLTWQPTSTLPVPIRGQAVVEYNGYVYSIGGRPSGEGAGTHAIADVYFAPINPDGSLGSWQATTSLPGNRAVLGAYPYNNRMYAWGGWDENYATINACYYATINSNGTLGAWTTSAVTIPDSSASIPQMDSFGRGILGYDKYLYIVGGERNDESIAPDVYYSEIQPSGDYGPWQDTTDLPTQDWFHGTAIVEGTSDVFIYLVGGNHGGTSESHVYRNTINPADGSLGASWVQIASLPVAVYELAIALTDEAIYSIGGLNGSTPQDGVTRLLFYPDTGNLIPVTATPLPQARARVAGVGYKVGTTQYLLVVGGGGYYAADPVLDTCLLAEIPLVLHSDGTWEMYE